MEDFFISYTQADVKEAKWVDSVLRRAGYTTVIQQRDFSPGNNFVVEMQRGITSCERMILIMTENYLRSDFCQAEWAAGFCTDVTGEKRKLTIVRVGDVRLEGLLASLVTIDLLGLDRETAEKKLLAGVGQRGDPGPDGEGMAVTLTLQEDGWSGPIPAAEKNRLRRWYFDAEGGSLRVDIQDKRQAPWAAALEKLEEKAGQEELTKEEESWYQECRRMLQRYERERQVKARAVELFLQDREMWPALCPEGFLQQLELIGRILDDDRTLAERSRDPHRIQLDVFLKPEPKDWRSYFVVPVTGRLLLEKTGVRSQYELYGLPVKELGTELIREIAAAFYIFLSQEAVVYGHEGILRDKTARRLWRYRIGLH